MKKLFAAALCFLGLAGVCQSSEVMLTREIDLESNFCKVVTLVMTHPEVIGGELIQKVPLKKGVALDKEKGPIWYQVSREQVEVKGEELWFKTHLALNKKSLVIQSNLDDESVFLNDSRLLVEFHEKKDGGTLVKIQLELDAETNGFFLRVGERAKTFKIERELRTLVGEPLSENEE